MEILLGFISLISKLIERTFSIIKSKPHISIEAEFVHEEGGGNSNVGGTVWNLWQNQYLNLCVKNTGAPTTIKKMYISVRNDRHEVLRFSPWKTLKYINYENPSKSPELNKTLQATRLETNDCWGPHIVLFTAQEIVTGENASLPDGAYFIIVESVGQKPVRVRL